MFLGAVYPQFPRSTHSATELVLVYGGINGVDTENLNSSVCVSSTLRSKEACYSDTYIGEATNDIFSILPDTGTDYNAAIASLTTHVDPVHNKDMDIYEFHQFNRNPRLKKKSILCEFSNKDGEIKTQIIHNTSGFRICRKVLLKQLDLKAILAYESPTLSPGSSRSKWQAEKPLAKATKVAPKVHWNFVTQTR